MRHNETVAAPFALIQFIQRYHTQEKNSVHDFYAHKASIYSEKKQEKKKIMCEYNKLKNAHCNSIQWFLFDHLFQCENCSLIEKWNNFVDKIAEMNMEFQEKKTN